MKDLTPEHKSAGLIIWVWVGFGRQTFQVRTLEILCTGKVNWLVSEQGVRELGISKLVGIQALRDNLCLGLRRRRQLRPTFWNKAHYQIGRPNIANRAGVLLNDINFDWAYDISDDTFRQKLKKQFNMWYNLMLFDKWIYWHNCTWLNNTCHFGHLSSWMVMWVGLCFFTGIGTPADWMKVECADYWSIAYPWYDFFIPPEASKAGSLETLYRDQAWRHECACHLILLPHQWRLQQNCGFSYQKEIMVLIFLDIYSYKIWV